MFSTAAAAAAPAHAHVPKEIVTNADAETITSLITRIGGLRVSHLANIVKAGARAGHSIQESVREWMIMCNAGTSGEYFPYTTIRADKAPAATQCCITTKAGRQCVNKAATASGPCQWHISKAVTAAKMGHTTTTTATTAADAEAIRKAYAALMSTRAAQATVEAAYNAAAREEEATRRQEAYNANAAREERQEATRRQEASNAAAAAAARYDAARTEAIIAERRRQENQDRFFAEAVAAAERQSAADVATQGVSDDDASDASDASDPATTIEAFFTEKNKWYAADTGKCHAKTEAGKRCTKGIHTHGVCGAHRAFFVNHTNN